jgi:hypothetical protein
MIGCMASTELQALTGAIDEDAEHNRASWWRRRVAMLKVEQLAEMTGYAPRTIFRFESGSVTDEQSWTRYRMTCAGVHAMLRGWHTGRAFEWKA